jgi:HlyD family secretion protein
MKKRIIRIFIALLLLAAVGFGVWYFFFRESETDENKLVLYGNVDIRQVELAFNANERIAEIRVEEGESVEKGQILALLETRRLEQAVKRAEAQLDAQREEVVKLETGTREEEIRKARAEAAAAKTEAENAEKTFRRLRPLAAKNLASQEQTDEAESKAEAARARLNAAEETLNLALAGPRREDIAAAKARLEAIKAELDIARKNLEDAQLIAPDHAVVQNRILQPGDMASPQRPVFTLALTNPVWVRAYVPQTDMGKIFPGMRAHIKTDSYPDKTYEGWIGYISPTAEFTPKSVETPEVRTELVYQVRVYACNPQNELRLGMPATVIVPLDQDREEAGDIPDCPEG